MRFTLFRSSKLQLCFQVRFIQIVFIFSLSLSFVVILCPNILPLWYPSTVYGAYCLQKPVSMMGAFGAGDILGI
jgi:hypothetical protein